MIVLRKAKEADLPVIRRIAAATYTPTYAHPIGAAQVAYMLNEFYSEAALLNQLIGGHTFLIAKEGTRDLGFAAYAPIEGARGVKLHKLYVLPEAHGKGVGKFLINEVRNKALEAGAAYLELNVNRDNKARAFYEKAGLNVKETVDIAIGNGFFMNDYVMELPLNPIPSV